ncbi:MAG: cob(I)yrinic acid a,c-diamide adenosyltransferase [Armatimonadota bacterium]
MSKGMIQVYTGNGKGKTTAALGGVLRALGNNMKVCIIQFMKGKETGEIKMLKGMDNVDINQFGTGEFLKKGDPSYEDYKAAEMALEFFKDTMNSRQYDLIILDEIVTAVNYGLIELWELVDAVTTKPQPLELILTGRDAPPEILKAADLVTEMLEIKHYYNNGIEAREGREY